MGNNKITIVINTFKSEDKINQCLDSINHDYKVIVVENSKNTNFKNEIEKNYSNVKCILAGENLGYAKGNNLGLTKVITKYALILNPDAKLENDTLNNFLISAEKIKDFCIMGPAKQDEYSFTDKNKDEENLFEVDSLKGFAMFFNIEQFHDIGFFDENFFIYLEEIDLCKRIKEKNRKIYLNKNIKIHHLGGSSHNKSIDFEMELSRNWHWMWSTFYFNKKHYGYFNSLIKVSGKLIFSAIKIIFYTLIFNHDKKKIYFHRFSGLYNSLIGKKSWYRPKIIIN
jgi:N-acetylglucosaminyl-diphospho-decaprenol L-rhamnosyltransferase